MRRREPGAGSPKPAFTLVELMVSIAILALLIGMLVPALSSMRGAARSTACQSHLRQMALAAHTYVTEYDAWPTALLYEEVDGQLRQVAWDWVTPFFGGGEAIGPGTLWSYIDNPDRVMQCPDYHGATNFDDPYTGYNYNTSYIGAEETFAAGGTGPVRAGVPPHGCHRGDRCACFGDGGRRNGTNKFMRAPHGPEGLAAGTVFSGGQAFRHLGGTNVAYVDGHVGRVGQAREGDDATPTLLELFMDYPRNGFLSDDDSAYDPR